MKPFRVSYVSLGCAKNQVDLEYLMGSLSDSGFETETDPSKCDAVVINTCGFIESAVKEAIENILLMAGAIPKHAKLIVTGCMAERYKDDILKEMPEIDFIAGAGKLDEAAVYLRKLAGVKKEGHGRIITNYPYYAYIKIAEGCNNRCSYCTIPAIRGHLKSRKPEEIAAEAAELVSRGVKEIIIVSQDTTKYGTDTGGADIIGLMKMLTSSHPDIYFRLLYLNPDGVTEKLIRFVASVPNIIKYFEIPVQHASDKILKAMSRRSNAEQINKVFDMIRSIVPEAFIRTTFIVGFPGEEEEDFISLLNFIKEKKPDFAGFFAYSQEDGTEAASFSGTVNKKTVASRMKKLTAAQEKNTIARLKSLGETIFPCFIEKTNDDFSFILEGRAIFQAPDIDGKLYVTDGVAQKGYGPYTCRINKIAYPDIYVTLENEA